MTHRIKAKRILRIVGRRESVDRGIGPSLAMSVATIKAIPKVAA